MKKKQQQDTLVKSDRQKTGNALIILTIIIHPNTNNHSVTLFDSTDAFMRLTVFAL